MTPQLHCKTKRFTATHHPSTEGRDGRPLTGGSNLRQKLIFIFNEVCSCCSWDQLKYCISPRYTMRVSRTLQQTTQYEVIQWVPLCLLQIDFATDLNRSLWTAGLWGSNPRAIQLTLGDGVEVVGRTEWRYLFIHSKYAKACQIEPTLPHDSCTLISFDENSWK